MKALMTATAVAALLAASPASGQTQDSLQDPMAGETPATSDPMAAPEAPDAMPSEEAMPSGEALPDTGEAAESQPEGTDDGAVAAGGQFIEQQGENEALASTLIGTPVQNPAGEDLGDINDLVLSEDGQVEVILVGVGGFLGIGEKKVGVSFDSIEKSADENGNVTLILDVSAETLEGAPAFVTINELQQQQQGEQPAASDSNAMAPTEPAQPSQ